MSLATTCLMPRMASLRMLSEPRWGAAGAECRRSRWEAFLQLVCPRADGCEVDRRRNPEDRGEDPGYDFHIVFQRRREVPAALAGHLQVHPGLPRYQRDALLQERGELLHDHDGVQRREETRYQPGRKRPDGPELQDRRVDAEEGTGFESVVEAGPGADYPDAPLTGDDPVEGAALEGLPDPGGPFEGVLVELPRRRRHRDESGRLVRPGELRRVALRKGSALDDSALVIHAGHGAHYHGDSELLGDPERLLDHGEGI